MRPFAGPAAIVCTIFADEVLRLKTEDMTTVLRNASFWESSMLTRTDADHDPIDPDVATTPLVNVAADGRVIGDDGSINFSAISNAGRIMIGARDICRTSRREALNMLKFLQKINNSSNASTRPRRAAGQSRNGMGVVPSPQRSLCRKETKHTSARPSARQKKTQRNRMCSSHTPLERSPRPGEFKTWSHLPEPFGVSTPY